MSVVVCFVPCSITAWYNDCSQAEGSNSVEVHCYWSRRNSARSAKSDEWFAWCVMLIYIVV